MTHVAATSIRARGGGIGTFVGNSGIAAMRAPSNPSNPVGFSPPPQGLLTLCFSGRASLRRANCRQFPPRPCRTRRRRHRHSSWRPSALPFPERREVSSPLRLASRPSARVVRASAAVACSGAGWSRVLRGEVPPRAHPQPARLLMLPITAVDNLPAGRPATSRINSHALWLNMERTGMTGRSQRLTSSGESDAPPSMQFHLLGGTWLYPCWKVLRRQPERRSSQPSSDVLPRRLPRTLTVPGHG